MQDGSIVNDNPILRLPLSAGNAAPDTPPPKALLWLMSCCQSNGDAPSKRSPLGGERYAILHSPVISPVSAFLPRVIPSNVEVSPTAARHVIPGEVYFGGMNGVDYSNGNADSMVLSERGRQAHVAKLPMTYFRPIMEMLKDPWCVAIRPNINATGLQECIWRRD